MYHNYVNSKENKNCIFLHPKFFLSNEEQILKKKWLHLNTSWDAFGGDANEVDAFINDVESLLFVQTFIVNWKEHDKNLMNFIIFEIRKIEFK